MKSYRIAIAFGALAAGLAFTPNCAQAQTAPIVVRTDAKPRAAGREWLKGEVIRADAQSIIVREQANGMAIHTFTFAPNIKDKMQAMLDKGGYQYGDKVRILYQQGQTVALKISGKPSKPL